MKTAITILNDTVGQLNVIGAAFKAPGYFGYTSGTSTVCWYMNNLIGRVYIEASLATNPKDSDWFALNLSGVQPYVEYPINPANPSGTTGDTGIDSYTFQGQFIWLRIRLDRSYLNLPSVNNVGSITKAYLNY